MREDVISNNRIINREQPMKIFLLFTFLILLALIGFGCIMNNKFESTDIDKAIDLTKSENHKKLLKDFKNQNAGTESILVTSHFSNFEIIVTNKSTEDYTGGAAQYFLDKKTGDLKMGWHEAPMKIEKHQ